MPNTTLNYLLARAPVSTICFSGDLTTASIYLPGPGGKAGDGFPMPRGGFLAALHVYDGTTHHDDFDHLEFSAGDRVSVYCQNAGSSFTIRVRLNGTSSGLEVTGVPFNSPLFVTVEFALLRN